MNFGFLRKVPLFADLPDTDLFSLCTVVEDLHLKAGERLFAEGDPADRAYVIKSGEMEVVKATAGRDVLLAVRGPGEVIGEMALLELKPRSATVRARVDSTVIAIRKEEIDHLLTTSLSAATTLFYTVLARWRASEALLLQNEKMAELGTLTAGVAHELNNPAAAVQRGASQLQDALEKLWQAQVKLSSAEPSPQQRERLDSLSQQARTAALHPQIMDALTRSDRESELETWLEQQKIPDAWDLAPKLVELNFEAAALGQLAQLFPGGQVGSVIQWLGDTYTAYHLLAEVGEGSRRISAIIKALKSYSYLDQAPVQAVNLHEGLDNTLLILQNKLKAGVHVVRDYAPDLPLIQGYGSELNQVWTNLLDNAIDAMEGKGEIVIRTRQESQDWVVVEIEDNGPGIPPAVKPRIFEPFYTTKPVGKGTGLGLHISFNIVVHKHRGEIKVETQPGKTCFQVKLPVNFETR